MLNYPEGSIITAYIQGLSILIKRTGNRMYRRELSLSTTEWPILVILARGESLGISEICDRLDRDKGHVSRDIAALAKRGLVRKRRDATDGRQILIEFNPEAEAERLNFLAIMRERSDKLTEGLTEDDLATLKRILMIMNRNAREMRGSDLQVPTS
ncbi:MAG: MarR family transcriptional regulator [Caulobacteraceae bacterium]|jgi:DNA-binding MarR family transcriptional regulator|nr:MarR family transcriptional regulator [Caulobacteraceae bacterium]